MKLNLIRSQTPVAWEGTADGFRVKVYDLGPGGFGPFYERYWLEFFPRTVGGGFWSESSRTHNGLLKKLEACVKEAREHKGEK